MNWTESLKLERKSFEKLLNQKHLEGKITMEQMYHLITKWKQANKPATKKDIDEVFNQ